MYLVRCLERCLGATHGAFVAELVESLRINPFQWLKEAKHDHGHAIALPNLAALFFSSILV